MQARRSLLSFHSKTTKSLAFLSLDSKTGSNTAYGSNIWWSRWSFATAVPSASSKPRKGQKVSKDERRAMVTAFVDKYRALNAGKYPTPSAAKREVGGCYYFLRQIIQELEYKSRTSPTSNDHNLLEKKLSQEERQPVPEAEEIPSSTETLGFTLSNPTTISNTEIDEAASNDLQRKGGPSVSSQNPLSLFESLDPPTIRGDCSNSARINSQQTRLENFEVLQPLIEKTEDSSNPEKEITQVVGHELCKPDGKIALDADQDKEIKQAAGQEVSKSYGQKAADQEASNSDNFRRDLSRDEIEDQLPQRSTVWENLRSFADGIINLWRKM